MRPWHKNSIIGFCSQLKIMELYTYGGYQEQQHILQPVDTAL